MNMLFEGTQRGLFSMLFGAGVVLLTSRYEAAGRTDAADIYYRRNIWLIAFGLVHSFLILWLGEILFYYGVCALFLYPIRNLKPKALIAIAIGGLAINAAWTYGEARVSAAAADKYETAPWGIPWASWSTTWKRRQSSQRTSTSSRLPAPGR